METENDFKVKICPYISCAKCAQKWSAFVYVNYLKDFHVSLMVIEMKETVFIFSCNNI